MLVKELKTLSRIQQHESLVKLKGAYLHEFTVSMVLEYMDRGSLDDHVTAIGELSCDAIACISYQILQGLKYLHGSQLLHRDLKPANILLNSVGQVKLCDFGLAALTDSMNTTILGTTKFMAPERLRGQAYGRSSDLWSFGLCLLQCVTGTAPFGECISLVELVVTVEEVGSVEEWLTSCKEKGLYEMVMACLQQEPGKTYSTFCLLIGV
jgi:serine/threonine protein kinase